MFRYFTLCALIVCVRGQTTAVSQCTIHEGDLPLNVAIEGCVTPPCLLPQLQNVIINVVFRAPRVLLNMRTLATASVNFGVGSFDVPYDLGQNAITCNFFTNTYCPLLKDEVVQYTLKMFIERFFPVDTQATVEFRVVDDNSDMLWCFRVPIRILPPAEQKRPLNLIERLA